MAQQATGGNADGTRAVLGRLWVIMVTGFVDMVGFLVVLPLLPFYAKRYGADPAMVGYLVGAFAFAQLASAPLWGRLSDRLGRRPVILAGIVASGLAYALFGVAETVMVLFVSRLVQGAGGGTIGVIQAYVTDSAGPSQGAKALGWVTAATSAGVMVGPAIGSLAFQLGESAPGFIAAGLCLLNLIFAWIWLPEPEREGDDDEAADAAPRAALWSSLLEVLRRPAGAVSSLIWIYAASMMAFMAMNGVLALYLDAVFGVDETTIGYFYVYVGAVSLVMRALLLGPIVDRLGEVRTLRLGALSLGLGLALVPLPGSIWALALAVLLIPVGTAMLFPATTSLVSRRARRGQTGQTLGVQQTFGGIARWLGPTWAGLLFQHLGIASPFWVAAALVGVVCLMTLKVRPGNGEVAPAATTPAAAAESMDPS